MEKIIKYIILSFTILFYGGCVDDNIASGKINDTGTYTEYATGLSGLSGLSLSVNCDFLYAACDNGNIYRVGLDGKVLENIYSGSNDFEAVAIRKNTGEIFLADERTMQIFQLYDGKLNVIVKIDIEDAVPNKGIEGITFCGENNLYIANQDSPAIVLVYDFVKKEITKRIKIPFAQYLSDICYDENDNILWILDGKSKKIYQCDTDCNLKKTFQVLFVEKPEALAVDSKNKLIWIGCDKSSRLYKLNINNLKE